MTGIFSGAKNLRGFSTPLAQEPNVSTLKLYQQASLLLAEKLDTSQRDTSQTPNPRADLDFAENAISKPPQKRIKFEDISEKHVFFDVETHGLSKVCLAIQLSFLVTEISRNQNGLPQMKVTDHFDGCFPADYISPAATKIHGIDLNDLRTLKDQGELHEWSDVAPRLLQHFRSADTVVGHNVAFDLRSIRDTLAYNGLINESQEFETIGREKKNCSLQMARAWTKTIDTENKHENGATEKPASHKLTALYQHIFGTDLTQAHDAAADTIATAALYYFLKGEDISATNNPPRPRAARLSEPAEIYNSEKNSMSWLVLEHNHDRRHIIPKSLLKLFINEGIHTYGGQTLAAIVLNHPRFQKMAETSLTNEAKTHLENLAENKITETNTSNEMTADILYILLKHNRFNYFLGESSWNRAIGAPMRYLRATEPKTLSKVNRSSKSQALKSIVSNAIRNVTRSLEAKHKNEDYNVSFEDPRGPDVGQEGALAVQSLKESLEVIEAAYLKSIQEHFDSNTPLKDIKQDVRGMIKNLQDSFAFDTSQSQNKDIRLTQNTHLIPVYTKMHQAIESKNLETFKQALHEFLKLDQAISNSGQIDADQVYAPQNPVYAARQLNQMILNHN